MYFVLPAKIPIRNTSKQNRIPVLKQAFTNIQVKTNFIKIKP